MAQELGHGVYARVLCLPGTDVPKGLEWNPRSLGECLELGVAERDERVFRVYGGRDV